MRFLWAFLLATPLAAQEYIVTDGPLTNGKFYSLVSCAAMPGQGCNEPIIRWDMPFVTVTFAPIPQTYLVDLAKEMIRALDATITQIDAASPGLSLRRVSKSQPANILLYLQPIRAGDAIRGTDYPEMDGVPIGAAQVQVF